MRSFKQYLNEATINFAPWHLASEDEIREKMSMDHFSITKKGYVNSLKSSGLIMANNPMPKGKAMPIENGYGLPVHFGNAQSFTIKSSIITNIWGAPVKAQDLTLRCDALETLDHLEGTYLRYLTLFCPKLKTLGTAKIKTPNLYLADTGYIPMRDFAENVEGLPSGDFTLTLSTDTGHHYFKKPLLSFLKIKTPGKKTLVLGNNAKTNSQNVQLFQLQQAIDIINKHTDAWKCQDELQDADLDDYADL